MDKDEDEAKTHLQWVSTSLSRKKKEISSMSSALTIGKRTIMPIGIFKRRNRSQKTSGGLGNLYVSDCNSREGG